MLVVVVHAANIQDRDGAKLVFAKAKGMGAWLRMERWLADEPVVGPHPRAEIYRLGTTLFIDRLLLAGPANWPALLRLAREWTPPELPVGGADVLRLGLKPGPKVGELLTEVERWWIAGDFTADRAACLAELERLAQAQ